MEWIDIWCNTLHQFFKLERVLCEAKVKISCLRQGKVFGGHSFSVVAAEPFPSSRSKPSDLAFLKKGNPKNFPLSPTGKGLPFPNPCPFGRRKRTVVRFFATGSGCIWYVHSLNSFHYRSSQTFIMDIRTEKLSDTYNIIDRLARPPIKYRIYYIMESGASIKKFIS